jgi:hypothetical protein
MRNMNKLIASMIAVAFLMSGSVMAASAATTPKAASTARPAITTHVGHKIVKATSTKNQNGTKAVKTAKAGKAAKALKAGKKPGKKTAGK